MPTKILVATGYESTGYDDSRTNSEVLELMNKPYMECQNMAPFLWNTEGATGGLVNRKTMFCGGTDSDLFYDECYRLTKKSTSLIRTMKNRRAYAASVVVNHDTLWILGGKSCQTDSCQG